MTVRFRDVRVAGTTENYVEIGSGLKEGDRVALNINNRIVEGDKDFRTTDVRGHGLFPQPPWMVLLAGPLFSQ
jgi:multidrug efflux pump subunit AcrA (membrane-fusion protein)